MTDTAPESAEAQAPVVQPEPGSRLEDLHSRYAVIKATADAAAKQLKDLTDAIKLELSQAAPEGASSIALTGEAGPPLRLNWVTSWRLDSRKLKAEDPETYVRYAKQSGSWVLKAAGGGSE